MNMSITKKGKFAGNPQKAEMDTRFKASEDGTVTFGKGVEYTDEDEELKEYSGGYFAGLALEANEKIGTDDSRDYDKHDTMKVLKKGIAYVELQEDVSIPDDGPGVGVDSSSSNFGTESSYDAIPAEFLEGGSTGDEVRVRFSLPGKGSTS